MRFGYGRVSNSDQDLALQQEALSAAGCDEIFLEKFSGTMAARPELDRLIRRLRRGDVVIVYRLDRLGRSLKNLVGLVEQLTELGVQLISLNEQIDTTTANGKLTLHLFATLAEFERNLISERTKAGLEAARKRGKTGGRPKALDEKKLRAAQAMLADPNLSRKDVAEQLGVSVSTLYRHV